MDDIVKKNKESYKVQNDVTIKPLDKKVLKETQTLPFFPILFWINVKNVIVIRKKSAKTFPFLHNKPVNNVHQTNKRKRNSETSTLLIEPKQKCSRYNTRLQTKRNQSNKSGNCFPAFKKDELYPIDVFISARLAPKEEKSSCTPSSWKQEEFKTPSQFQS